MVDIGLVFGYSHNDTERFSLVVWMPSPAILIILQALKVASKELVYTIWSVSVRLRNEWISVELTSPNAEEKCYIKEGIPSNDDLWKNVCLVMEGKMEPLTEIKEATAQILQIKELVINFWICEEAKISINTWSGDLCSLQIKSIKRTKEFRHTWIKRRLESMYEFVDHSIRAKTVNDHWNSICNEMSLSSNNSWPESNLKPCRQKVFFKQGLDKWSSGCKCSIHMNKMPQ